MIAGMFRILIGLAAGGMTAVIAAPAGPAFATFPAIASQPWAAKAQLVEIRGERGSPQPAEWIATFKDPTARGGLREVTVVNGKITGERTPVNGDPSFAPLLPVRQQSLTTDSDSVFRIVHREAQKGEVGFDWVEYRLRAVPPAAVPVWDVTLFDHLGARAGSIRISAQGGNIVQGFQGNPNLNSHPELTAGRKEDGFLSGISRSVGKAARETGDETRRFVDTLKEELGKGDPARPGGN